MNAGPIATAGEPRRGLLRILGLGFSVAVVVGGTVGVGILRTPGDIASLLRTPGLIFGIWLLGGAYVLLGSLSVAELGTMLPWAGGFYAYVRRALGDGAGLLIGMMDWLGQSAAVSWGAVTVVEFAGFLIPELAGRGGAIAVGIILGFGLLHWSGLRVSSEAQKWSTVVKAVAFAALVAACFRTPAAAAVQPAAPPRGWALAAGAIVALQAVIITYDGWYAAIYFAEEDRNPGHNLPRAMVGATLAVIALYLLLNAGFLRVLGVAGLAVSKQPAADAVARIAGATAAKLVTAVSIISLLPLINAVLMTSTRILFGLSRDGLIPGALSPVNPRGTPVALWATVLAAGLLAATGTYRLLVAFASFLFVVNHCAAFLSLLVLRRREPEAARPFRVPLYPWVPVAALGGGVSYLGGALISDPANSGLGLAAVVAGCAGYRLLRRARRSGSSRLG